MGILRKTQEQPLTAATVRTFDRLPDRPNVTFQDSELWRLYRCVPEIHYAVNQQARLVGRLKWDVEVNGQPVDDSEEVMRRTFGKQLRSIAVMAAIHLQVVGRYYLVHIPPPQDSDLSKSWGGEWRVLNSPHTHDQKALAESADILVEVIIEDPADSKRADSAVMAVRDIATELLLARMQARRAHRSRIAQLMTLIYPKEGAGPDPAKFEREWIRAASAPMGDEKASESAVPNLIGWPSQYIEQIRTLDLTGPIDEKLAERIDRLIGQLAIGLDIAPSLLTGMEDSSHWTAWAAQEDNWLGHVEPLAAPVGESFSAGLAKAIRQDPDTIDITPDPAPLLKRRPAITDVLTAWEKGLVNAEWAREQLGAPETAAGTGVPEPTTETITVQEANAEPSLERGQQRQITQEVTQAPTAAAVGTQGVEIDGARLADIDDQAYTSLQDLIADVAERILEKLGARIRASLQGRDTDLPRDVSNAELARLYTGDIPNADQTIEQTARDAVAKVTRVVHRAQGRLRAAGIDVPESPPDDPSLIGAQEAFVAAVLGVVAAMRAGRPGVAEAWAAARAIATIAGGGEAQDFRNAASGIALAAATMAVIRRDHGLAPRTGPGSHRWLHLYQGPDPHPVHLSLKDALFNGVSVFAGGYVAFPGDHAGCECIAVPAELVRVDTGWRGNQP